MLIASMFRTKYGCISGMYHVEPATCQQHEVVPPFPPPWVATRFLQVPVAMKALASIL